MVNFSFFYLSANLLLNVSNSDPQCHALARMHAHSHHGVFCSLPVESSELNSNAMESFECTLTCCTEVRCSLLKSMKDRGFAGRLLVGLLVRRRLLSPRCIVLFLASTFRNFISLADARLERSFGTKSFTLPRRLRGSSFGFGLKAKSTRN